MGLYSEVEKHAGLAADGETSQAAQPLPEMWSSRPCDTSLLLHKAHRKCFSREAVQLPERTRLRRVVGGGPLPRQKQSRGPSASPNSSTCLKVIHLPAPVLPSVKC